MEAKQGVGKCKLLCLKTSIHLLELHTETRALEYLSGLVVLLKQANPQAQHIAFSQAPEVDAILHVSCYCTSQRGMYRKKKNVQTVEDILLKAVL